MATFGTLSDRLTETFRNLRTKGKLTPADVDGTVREIRRALLDADVALPVVKEFTAKVRERALGDEVNKALNPAQQVVQIVNEELVAILGGQQRRLQFAKNPPTIIMLAGLQGSGKTTFAGKLAKLLEKEGHTPLLIAADLQRPNAVNQLQVVAGQAGAAIYAPAAGQRRRRPRAGRARRCRGRAPSAARHRHHRHRRPSGRRRRDDEAGRRHPSGDRPRRSPVRHRRDERPGRRQHGEGVPGRRRLHGRRPVEARRRLEGRRSAVGRLDHRPPDHLRVHG